MRMIRTVATIALVLAVGMLLVLRDDGWAQEKRKIAWTAPAPNSKYTQQHTIDVGDVPGHQVRIVEIHQTYPGGAPVFDGVRVVEDWFRGYSDYTNANGHAWGYGQYVLENGDKIFARWESVNQTVVAPDGSKKTSGAAVGALSGGTGRFRGIRGTLRATNVFNPHEGWIERQYEGEYWIE